MVERHYTTAEIAEIMGVTNFTVREWLKDESHPLVGVKFGHTWRVPESNLKDFLEARHG